VYDSFYPYATQPFAGPGSDNSSTFVFDSNGVSLLLGNPEEVAGVAGNQTRLFLAFGTYFTQQPGNGNYTITSAQYFEYVYNYTTGVEQQESGIIYSFFEVTPQFYCPPATGLVGSSSAGAPFNGTFPVGSTSVRAIESTGAPFNGTVPIFNGTNPESSTGGGSV